jgi:hypothetical protein
MGDALPGTVPVGSGVAGDEAIGDALPEAGTDGCGVLEGNHLNRASGMKEDERSNDGEPSRVSATPIHPSTNARIE